VTAPQKIALIGCSSAKLDHAAPARDVKPANVPCDFCGTSDAPLAVSELGAARFAGDDTPARICERCATWALEQLRGVTT
jgi:hypothetical protein